MQTMRYSFVYLNLFYLTVSICLIWNSLTWFKIKTYTFNLYIIKLNIITEKKITGISDITCAGKFRRHISINFEMNIKMCCGWENIQCNSGSFHCGTKKPDILKGCLTSGDEMKFFIHIYASYRQNKITLKVHLYKRVNTLFHKFYYLKNFSFLKYNYAK